MRNKRFFKKLFAGIMVAAVAFSSVNATSIFQSVEVLADESAENVKYTFGYGNSQVELEPGTYTTTVRMLNAYRTDMTEDDYLDDSHLSMAKGAIKDEKGTIVVHKDGTATMTLNLDKVHGGDVYCYGEDWTIYQSPSEFLNTTANNDRDDKIRRVSVQVDETIVDGRTRKPIKISFTIPSEKWNCVYINVFAEAMGGNPDAAFGIDWKNIQKVSDDTSDTSTVEGELVSPKNFNVLVGYDIYDDFKEANAALTEGKTLKLGTDVTVDEKTTIAGGTIDLNGHILDLNGYDVTVNGDLKIIDSSKEKTGALNSTGETPYFDFNNKLVLDGIKSNNVDFYGNKTNQSEIEVYNSEVYYIHGTGNRLKSAIIKDTKTDKLYIDGRGLADSSITMENVEIEDTSTVVRLYAQNVNMKDVVSGTMQLSASNGIVDNAKITSTSAASFAALTIYYRNSITSNVTIKGGEFVGGSYAIDVQEGPVKIEGGYYKGSEGIIYGGYVVNKSGYALKEVMDGDYAGYYTLQEGKVEINPEDYVAELRDEKGNVIGGFDNDSVSGSLYMAEDGQTVALTKDVNIANTLSGDTIVSNKNVTLDLNGHSLTVTSPICIPEKRLTVIDSSKDKTGELICTANGAITVDNKRIDADGNNVGEILLKDVYVTSNMAMAASPQGIYKIRGGMFDVDLVKLAGSTSGFDIGASEWKASSEEIEDAKAKLSVMINAARYYLVKNEENNTYVVTPNELGKAIEANEFKNEADYTKASWTTFSKAYEEALSLISDATEDEIKTAAEALNKAAEQLVASASDDTKEALSKAVEEANKVDSKSYTEASYKALQEAVTAAEKALDERVSQEEMEKIAGQLKDAMDKLEKVKVEETTIQAEESTTGKIEETTTTKNVETTTKVEQPTTAKAKQSMKVAAKKKSVKFANVKKKNVQIRKAVVVNKAQGNVVYTKVKKGSSSKLFINKKGKIVIKKGTKKGTYKIKVKVTAKGNENYLADSKIVTVTIKVK